MKSKKLQDAIGMIDEDLVERAEKSAKPKKAKILKWVKWTAPIAAMLVIAFTVGIFFGNGSPMNLNAHAIYQAEYPEMAEYPGNEMLPGFEARYNAWRKDQRAQKEYYGAGKTLAGFIQKSTAEILSETGTENRVYSPLNVYMALAMLAEITDGNSREQILNLLGSENIEALRTQANAVWNANYNDDGSVTSILASSIWMNQDIAFNDATMKTLASNYYASSYRGEMGSHDFNQALQEWLNQQTGGLLDDYISDIEMNPNTVLALATTIYFQAKWGTEFSESRTEKAIFHGANGDTETDFMHETETYGSYYWGEKFSAASKALENSGNMWFILPDEDVSVDELLADAEALSFMTANGKWQNRQTLQVNFSIPKFDVQSKIDLVEDMQNLGITDCFIPDVSDYTPLLDESAMHLEKDIYLDKAEHGARVAIDEEGVTAAAYTVLILDGAGACPEDEIDFVVDRPFIFVITGSDGLPLFIGVVNQI
ncbi:MAG: serpin family protein [Clostridia bacterium]|nr:serpin family protein [Clostridia bacterium]